MKTLRIFVSLVLMGVLCNAQKTYKSATIGFYNVENLFDTEESIGYIDGTKSYKDEFFHVSHNLEDTLDLEYEPYEKRFTRKNLEGKKVLRRLILTDEFTPEGPKAWTQEKYNQKLTNLAKVIEDLGSEITKTAPAVVGLVEVENRQVVEDLVNHPTLKPYNYKIVHYNSLDKRGIDCALIYQEKRFKVTDSEPYELVVYNNDNGYRDYTRDILRVSGELDGEKIHFIVNHWPSRRGGSLGSDNKRVAAGKLLRQVFEEIRYDEPNAKIIAMGDFNDDPTNNSMRKALGAKAKKSKLKKGDVFNYMAQMHKKGFGTLAYRDGWNLFDQIVATENLVDRDKQFKTFEIFKTAIYSPNYLIAKEGQYKGYPNRMFGGDSYRANGYSDHFPVYTILLKEN